MKFRWLTSAVLAAGLIGFLAGSGFSEDPPPSEDEMMEMMMKLGEPGPAHERLASMAGSFAGTAKYFMKPGEEPVPAPAKSTNTWILGGRFLQSEFTSPIMGKAFHGRGVMGHDNFKKHYVSTWIDNWSSSIAMQTGTASEDGKTLTLDGTWDGPMGKMGMRHVYTVLSKDEYRLEGFMISGDQTMKNMDIVFKRVIEPAAAPPVCKPRARPSKGPGY